jgi:citrate/tricarballylate utilization protein
LAASLAERQHGLPAPDLVAEAARQLTICNACRYCEGYCAVYPAMELRTTFGRGDIVHLANLCHDCRACLYACQYAPPHPFEINVPKTLAAVRRETYRDYSWPGALRRMFQSNGASVQAIALASIAIVVVLLVVLGEPGQLLAAHTGPGAFYEVVPYEVLVASALLTAIYALLVFAFGAVRFWRDTRSSLGELIDLRALAQALGAAFDLRYLRGGRAGCFYPASRRSDSRRLFHMLVFYGFLADIVSTTAAAIEQDVFGVLPPFPLLSVPVVFGTVGGVALIVGVVGLVALKRDSDVEPSDDAMREMDVAFLVLLGLTSLSGLGVLALRTTAAMPLVLAVHLGLIAALFLTAPYGKFAHVVYRYAALVRNAIEQRQAE